MSVDVTSDVYFFIISVQQIPRSKPFCYHVTPISNQMQTPQPNIAYFRRAILDEARPFISHVGVGLCLFLTQNVQYFLLAYFWWTSKPVACVYFTLESLGPIDICPQSCSFTLHHIFPVPRSHLHSGHVDATVSSFWSSRDRWWTSPTTSHR